MRPLGKGAHASGLPGRHPFESGSGHQPSNPTAEALASLRLRPEGSPGPRNGGPRVSGSEESNAMALRYGRAGRIGAGRVVKARTSDARTRGPLTKHHAKARFRRHPGGEPVLPSSWRDGGDSPGEERHGRVLYRDPRLGRTQQTTLPTRGRSAAPSRAQRFPGWRLVGLTCGNHLGTLRLQGHRGIAWADAT